ncbi:hypothetical protein GSbR_35300 [Geobacter sp. SVR]|nr:hypothetical protein GSVR_28710 [Geobacter sp. SVR]GCF86930.1 hypothetical protein GSbR_35300 [Geobacter sp. SVR]
MEVMVRHYLHCVPSENLDDLMKQYSEALWIEERVQLMMTGAVAKGMGGK